MQIETRIDLDRALSTLTGRQRAVLYAVEVLGLRQEDVAEVLGVQQAATCKYLQRTKRQLKAAMME